MRALQSHQTPRPTVGPGYRVAVNLAGVAHHDVGRGDALVRAGQWAPTRTFDASLTVLAAVGRQVSRRGAYHLYVGSAEHAVSLRVLGRDAIAAGASGLVRLHLPVEVPLLPGDRYVLRERGRDETVGGGEILDVAPVLPAAKAAPSRSVDRVVAERGWVDASDLERLTGERRTPTLGRWVVDPAALAETSAAVAAAVDAAGPLGLDVSTLDERQKAVLPTIEGVVVEAGRARLGGADSGPDASHPFVRALEAQPFSPPDPESFGVDRAELREMVRRGLVIEREGAWFAPSAIGEAGLLVAGLLARDPAGVTVAAVRDALGTSRKHVLPLLAELDATGVTRRRGDVRVAGPRLPPG